MRMTAMRSFLMLRILTKTMRMMKTTTIAQTMMTKNPRWEAFTTAAQVLASLPTLTLKITPLKTPTLASTKVVLPMEHTGAQVIIKLITMETQAITTRQLKTKHITIDI